jgi:hypothetical protein
MELHQQLMLYVVVAVVLVGVMAPQEAQPQELAVLAAPTVQVVEVQDIVLD